MAEQTASSASNMSPDLSVTIPSSSPISASLSTPSSSPPANNTSGVRVMVRFRPLPSSNDREPGYFLDGSFSGPSGNAPQDSPRSSPRVSPSLGPLSISERPGWNSTPAKPSEPLPPATPTGRRSIGQRQSGSAFTSPRHSRQTSVASGSPSQAPADATCTNLERRDSFNIGEAASSSNAPYLQFEGDSKSVTLSSTFLPPQPASHSRRNSSISSMPTASSSSASSNTTTRSYTFDKVFSSEATQAEVFDYVAAPSIDCVLRGENSSVLAYGQTSSGKTYSMFGYDASDAGIIPRTVEELFTAIAELKSRTVEDGFHASEIPAEVNVSLSFVEIYMENCRDLLLQPGAVAPELKVREANGETFVQNLREVRVSTLPELLGLLAQGSRNRTTSATKLNASSSRAHALVILSVHQRMSEGSIRASKLYLADLAGSERVKNSGVGGRAMKESQYINSSLAALSVVIVALTSRNRSHVPYRDSVLTHLLRSSLSGEVRTTLLCCASSSTDAATVAETLNTLEFAKRSKKIRVNAPASSNQPQRQRSVEELTKMVSALRDQLRSLQGEKFSSATSPTLPMGIDASPLPATTNDVGVQAPASDSASDALHLLEKSEYNSTRSSSPTSSLEELSAHPASLKSRWELLAEVVELSSEVVRLQSQVEVLSSTNGEYVAQVSNLESSIRSLQSILESKQQQQQAAAAVSPSMKTAELEAQLIAAQGNYEALKSSSSKTIDELREQMESERTKHAAQLAKLETDLAFMRSSTSNSQPNSPSNEAPNVTADATYQNLLQEVRATHKTVASLTGEKEVLLSNLKQKNEEINHFATQIGEIQHRFDSIVIEKARSDDQVASLIRNYETSDTITLSLKTQISTLESKNEILATQLKQALDSLALRDSDVERLTSERKDRDKEHIQHHERQTSTEAELLFARSQAAEQSLQLNSLREQVSNLQSELSTLQGQESAHELLREKVDRQDVEIGELSGNISNLLDKYKLSQDKIVESQFELEQMTKENQIHLQTIEDLHLQSETLKKEVQEAQTQLEEQRKKATTEDTAAKPNEDENTKLEEQEQLIEEYQGMLKRKEEKYNTELEKLRAELDTAKAALKATKQPNKDSNAKGGVVAAAAGKSNSNNGNGNGNNSTSPTNSTLESLRAQLAQAQSQIEVAQARTKEMEKSGGGRTRPATPDPSIHNGCRENIQHLEAKNDTLEQELEAIKLERVEMQARLKEHQNQANSSATQLKELTAASQLADQQIAQLQSQLSDTESAAAKQISEFQSSQQHLQTQKEALEKSEAGLTKAVESIEALEAEVREKSHTIEQLTQQVDSHQLSLEASKVELAASEKSVASLQSQLENTTVEKSQQVQTVNQQLQEKDKEIHKLQQLIAQDQIRVQEELSLAEGRLAETKAALQASKDELDRSKAELDRINSDSQAAQEELHRQLLTVNKENEKLILQSKDQVHSSNTAKAELDRINSVAQAKLEELHQQLSAANKENETLTSQAKDHLHALEVTKAELEQVNSDSKAAQEELHSQLLTVNKENEKLNLQLKDHAQALEVVKASTSKRVAEQAAATSASADGEHLATVEYQLTLAKQDLAKAQESFSNQLAAISRELSLSGTEVAFVRSVLAKTQSELETAKLDVLTRDSAIEQHATALLAAKKVGVDASRKFKQLRKAYEILLAKSEHRAPTIEVTEGDEDVSLPSPMATPFKSTNPNPFSKFNNSADGNPVGSPPASTTKAPAAALKSAFKPPSPTPAKPPRPAPGVTTPAQSPPSNNAADAQTPAASPAPATPVVPRKSASAATPAGATTPAPAAGTTTATPSTGVSDTPASAQALASAKAKISEYVKLLQKKDGQIASLNKLLKEAKEAAAAAPGHTVAATTSTSTAVAPSLSQAKPTSPDRLQSTVNSLLAQLEDARHAQQVAEFALSHSPYGIEGQLWRFGSEDRLRHNNHNAGPRIIKSVKVQRKEKSFLDGLTRSRSNSTATSNTEAAAFDNAESFDPDHPSIALQGYLHQKPTTIDSILAVSTSWKKRYAVLRGIHRRLEIYSIVDEVDSTLTLESIITVDATTKVSFVDRSSSSSSDGSTPSNLLDTFEVIDASSTKSQFSCHDSGECAVWIDALLTLIARINVEEHQKALISKQENSSSKRNLILPSPSASSTQSIGTPTLQRSTKSTSVVAVNGAESIVASPSSSDDIRPRTLVLDSPASSPAQAPKQPQSEQRRVPTSAPSAASRAAGTMQANQQLSTRSNLSSDTPQRRSVPPNVPRPSPTPSAGTPAAVRTPAQPRPSPSPSK